MSAVTTGRATQRFDTDTDIGDDRASAQRSSARRHTVIPIARRAVDVAIPCYNYAHFLADAAQSALTQSGVDVRVLIVDNASTDCSRHVAIKLALADPRVHLLLRDQNIGPHASFNAGIKWATAPYFMVLSADDCLAPGALRRAVDALEANPDCVMTRGRAISVFGSDPLPALSDNPNDASRCTIVPGHAYIAATSASAVNAVSGCTVLVRTSVQKAIGYYRPSLPHTDDFEMWLRLATAGNIVEIANIQGLSRIHATNQSLHYHADQSRDLRETLAAYESFFANEGAALPNAKPLLHRARRSVGERAWWSAGSQLVRGHPAVAARLMRLAAQTAPRTLIIPPLGYLSRIDSPLARFRRAIAASFSAITKSSLPFRGHP